jgi:DNA polymerase
MTEQEIKTGILAWREASPAIVELWGGQWRKTPGRWDFYREFYGIEGMTVLAIANPGTEYTYRDLKFGVFGDVLYIRLPSGRCLSYHEPRLNVGTDPRGQEVQQISFMGMDGYTHKWERISTHGAKLAENITQSAARDILAAALLRVNAAGYPPVLHVHDEIVSEVPIGFGSVEEFERLMEVREPWFADWPISASGGWRGHRYRK